MKISVIAARSMPLSMLLTVGVTVAGINSAAAAGDFTTLSVDPNVVTDTMAYSAAPPILNPNGQPGVSVVYTHRDSSRQITNTVLVLPDPAAAAAALNGWQIANKVANGKTESVPIGTGGTIITGMSPDGTKSVALLQFTEANTATITEFDGAPKDPAPKSLVREYGDAQDAAIKTWLAT